jgi:radical SAM protein with 4Fe4S-binding SPASM domain
MLNRVVVPSRLALIHRAGETLGYNPGLNVWERLDEETAEVLRWLRAGRDRGALALHLARRFERPEGAGERLSRILAWCVLRRLLYLDKQPALPALDHGPSPLDTVYWICTQACNLRCTYCYQDAAIARPHELSTEEARGLILQAVEARASTFIFTGGEPFVRRDLLELARFAKDAGLITNVITNGHYITPKNVREVAATFDQFTISVDGTMAHHDRSRGRGSWAHAARAIELLVGERAPVDVNSVLTKLGLADAEALLRLVREWRVGEHRIIPQFPMGRGGGSRDDELSEAEVLSLGDHLYRAGISAGSPHSPEGSYGTKGIRRNHCGAGLSEVSVDPEGWVYPCRLLQYPELRTHNIREHRLAEIYARHPVLQATRGRTSEAMHPCKTCIIQSHCGGGCRGIHHSFTHSYTQADPLFCAYLRHIFEVQAWSATGPLPPARRASFYTGAPPVAGLIPASTLIRAPSPRSGA